MLSQLLQEKIQTLPSYSENSFAILEAEFLALLLKGQFRIRTLFQARQLAFHLSYLCPNPPRIAVGLTELFINAIEHGNLEITFEEKTQFSSEQAWLEEIERRSLLPQNKHKVVEISVHRHQNIIQFVIKDEGKGFHWDEFIQKSNLPACHKHGRGIILAKLMSFDQLYYTDPGNCVTCIVDLDKKS